MYWCENQGLNLILDADPIVRILLVLWNEWMYLSVIMLMFCNNGFIVSLDTREFVYIFQHDSESEPSNPKV